MTPSGGGRVTFDFDGDKVQDIFDGLEATGRVAYTTDYAVYVEKPTMWAGTKPPFDPLRRWVDRKWPDLDGGLKAAALGSQMQPGSDAHKDAVAWIVVNAIAENGIDGIFYAGRALEKGISAADSIAGAYEGSDDPLAAKHIVEDMTDFTFGVSQEIIADEATDTGNLLQSGQVTITHRGEDETHEDGGFSGGGG